MAQIAFVKGVNPGVTVRLEGERIVLGRNADCGVVLNEPAVSREHAVIRKIQGKFFIEDLKSRNGTFVNNKEVKSRTALKDKDRIKICDNLLTFFESEAGDEPVDEPEEETSTIEATLAANNKPAFSTQSADKLAMLIEMGQELSQTFNLDQLLPKVVDSLFSVFRQADRAFIILSDDGKLIPQVTKTRRVSDDGSDARFSRKIVNMCIDTGQALLWEDASSGKVIELSQSIADCKIRSVMCVPLMSRNTNKAFGVIQLDTLDRFKKFAEDDLKLLLAVAGQAAVAIENANMHDTIVARAGLERDLKVAQQVQKSFLPKAMPAFAGYEFFAHYEAAQEVGGDYYDFIPLPGPRLGVMIGDVAGKGIPAALFMAKVSSDLRYCALTEPRLDTVVTRLNVLLQEAAGLDRFVTLGACLVDPGAHEVSFVSAGHMLPLVFRKAKQAFEEPVSRDITGFPLGTVDGYQYEMAAFRLDPGDTVVLYTDGVTDSRSQNESVFAMEGMMKALGGGPMSPKLIVERLMSAIRQHAVGRKPHDDITVVSFGRVG
jgi:sigma-B regulation protein RsbU (phosphoserine phosphatase)